ncbi:unnamed protein product [Pieris macdunnoughi]|uniref:Uncharacterized protein n=1 Tax=Pieris macdunnoughi TaxID=345717 RepID=A0A821SVB3_9NEOP|nr:unnamed protein product [Pieris macdunnoughi]
MILLTAPLIIRVPNQIGKQSETAALLGKIFRQATYYIDAGVGACNRRTKFICSLWTGGTATVSLNRVPLKRVCYATANLRVAQTGPKVTVE